MKSVLLLSALLAVPAIAAQFTGVGSFVAPHEIAFMNYPDAAACQADQGRWEDDLCVMDASDEVKITRESEITKVEINTITTNAHTCSYEAPAAFNAKGQLVSTAESQTYNPEKGAMEPSTCEVTLTFKDGNTVSAATNGNCDYFCGMNAHLDVDNAKRVEAK